MNAISRCGTASMQRCTAVPVLVAEAGRVPGERSETRDPVFFSLGKLNLQTRVGPGSRGARPGHDLSGAVAGPAFLRHLVADLADLLDPDLHHVPSLEKFAAPGADAR